VYEWKYKILNNYIIEYHLYKISWKAIIFRKNRQNNSFIWKNVLFFVYSIIIDDRRAVNVINYLTYKLFKILFTKNMTWLVEYSSITFCYCSWIFRIFLVWKPPFSSHHCEETNFVRIMLYLYAIMREIINKYYFIIIW